MGSRRVFAHALFIIAVMTTDLEAQMDPWQAMKPVSLSVWTVASSSDGHIAAGTVEEGTRGSIFLSTDNGESWSQVLKAPGRILSIVFRPDGYVFASADGALTYRSTDGGRSWTEKILDPGLLGSFVYVFALTADSEGNLFAGTNYTSIFKSTNSGETWSKTGMDSLGVQDFTTSSVRGKADLIFAGTWGGVYRSTDGGTSWQRRNVGIIGLAVGAIASSPSGTLFAGGDRGIWRSTNYGESWTAANEGLTNLSVRDIAVAAAVRSVCCDEWWRDLSLYR